jgi:Reverse transcriptase (RNA-dependent DNA polymerase)
MFSPVMCMDSLHNLIAITAILELEMGQMDIRGAYLNGDLHESMYMWQPKGYEDGTNRVTRLVHTLYGLKQSGQEWNSKFNAYITGTLKYTRLPNDHCIYIRCKGKEFNIIAIWVDNVIFISSSKVQLDTAKDEIRCEFETTDQGTP